ncbi:MAG: hypothetical protein LBF71_05545 [Campylobacteraceae bacterium]|jgi:hypothetical protein|nr:hypothetical protein [Campylobacteraceae bacterium]
MKTNILISAAIGIAFLVLLFGFFLRGKTIDILNAEVKAFAYEKALCEQDKDALTSAITAQNDKIAKQKTDYDKAVQSIINEHAKSLSKWQNIVKQAQKNSTCEMRLEEIDKMHKKFFEERK